LIVPPQSIQPPRARQFSPNLRRMSENVCDSAKVAPTYFLRNLSPHRRIHSKSRSMLRLRTFGRVLSSRTMTSVSASQQPRGWLQYLHLFVLNRTPSICHHLGHCTDDDEFISRTKYNVNVPCTKHGCKRGGVSHSSGCTGGVSRAERPVRNCRLRPSTSA
jgi:hypothetical protein